MKSSTSQKDLQKSNASELPSQGKAASALVLDGWDSIVLEYSVDWPLQLFFTPDVLSKKVSQDISNSQKSYSFHFRLHGFVMSVHIFFLKPLQNRLYWTQSSDPKKLASTNQFIGSLSLILCFFSFCYVFSYYMLSFLLVLVQCFLS